MWSTVDPNAAGWPEVSDQIFAQETVGEPMDTQTAGSETLCLRRSGTGGLGKRSQLDLQNQLNQAESSRSEKMPCRRLSTAEGPSARKKTQSRLTPTGSRSCKKKVDRSGRNEKHYDKKKENVDLGKEILEILPEIPMSERESNNLTEGDRMMPYFAMEHKNIWEWNMNFAAQMSELNTDVEKLLDKQLQNVNAEYMLPAGQMHQSQSAYEPNNPIWSHKGIPAQKNDSVQEVSTEEDDIQKNQNQGSQIGQSHSKKKSRENTNKKHYDKRKMFESTGKLARIVMSTMNISENTVKNLDKIAQLRIYNAVKYKEQLIQNKDHAEKLRKLQESVNCLYVQKVGNNVLAEMHHINPTTQLQASDCVMLTDYMTEMNSMQKMIIKGEDIYDPQKLMNEFDEMNRELMKENKIFEDQINSLRYLINHLKSPPVNCQHGQPNENAEDHDYMNGTEEEKFDKMKFAEQLTYGTGPAVEQEESLLITQSFDALSPATLSLIDDWMLQSSSCQNAQYYGPTAGNIPDDFGANSQANMVTEQEHHESEEAPLRGHVDNAPAEYNQTLVHGNAPGQREENALKVQNPVISEIQPQVAHGTHTSASMIPEVAESAAQRIFATNVKDFHCSVLKREDQKEALSSAFAVLQNDNLASHQYVLSALKIAADELNGVATNLRQALEEAKSGTPQVKESVVQRTVPTCSILKRNDQIKALDAAFEIICCDALVTKGYFSISIEETAKELHSVASKLLKEYDKAKREH